MPKKHLPTTLASALLLASAIHLRGDIMPGADWYLANALTVLLIHTPSTDELKTLPPDLQKSFIVDSVLKGRDTRRYIPAFGPDQPPGTRAIVLIPFQETPFSPITVTPKEPERREENAFWPLTGPAEAPIVQTDIQMGWGDSGKESIPLADLQKLLADESSLYPQMLDALLFPTASPSSKSATPPAPHSSN